MPLFPGLTGLDFSTTVDLTNVRGSDINTLNANEGWYWRVRDRSPLISKIGLEVVVQSGNISVAAYRNSGTGRSSVPGVQLATSGAIACPSGVTQIALGSSISLAAGDWLALSCDNGTATFRSILSGTLITDMGAGRIYVQTSAHPLPATPSSLSAAVGKSIALYGV